MSNKHQQAQCVRAWVAAAEVSPAGGTCPVAPVPSFAACHRRLSGVQRSARVRGSLRACSRDWSQKQGRRLTGLLEFRAWEGRVRKQESWLTRQVPAWTPIRTLRVPAPCHRAEALVAVRGQRSGTSRSSLPAPGAQAGSSKLRALSPGVSFSNILPSSELLRRRWEWCVSPGFL